MNKVKKLLIYPAEFMLSLFVYLSILPKVKFFHPFFYKFRQKSDVLTVTSQKDFASYLMMVFSLRRFLNSDLRFIAISDGSLGYFNKLILKLVSIELVYTDKYKSWQEMKYLFLAEYFSKYIIYIDSDVLFYRYPKTLLNNNRILFMEDNMSRYALSIDEIEYFYKVTLRPRVNTGIFKINTSFINKEYYYLMFAALKRVSNSRGVLIHLLEQTTYAYLLSMLSKKGGDRYKVNVLPKTYCMHHRVGIIDSKELDKLVCIHFTHTRRLSRVYYSFKLLLNPLFLMNLKN